MGTFIDQLTQSGINTAQSLVGTGMGLLLEKHNDKRQLEQQQKLQDQQIKGQKEMTNYNMQKQLQMWKDTNYGAQVEQLNKAGLNPGLIYGMGGGGGTTIGNASGNVSGAQAPSGGQEVQNMIGQQLQYALLNAQKQNIEADTQNKLVDAAKKSGVDTKEAIARTNVLDQEYDNLREDFQIKRLQQTMSNIENYEKQASQEDRLDYIEYQAKIASKQAIKAANEANLSTASLQNQIEIIRQQAIGAGIENEFKKSNIEVNKEKINQWIQTNMREWDKMSQENQKIQIQRLVADYTTDPVNKATDQISHLIHSIFKATTK